MKNNYYKELVSKLESLIQEQKFVEAHLIINEELSLPYVPMKLEEKLMKMKKTITPHIVETKTALAAEKIFEILLKENQIEKVDLIDSLSEYNLTNYDEEIKRVLISTEEEVPYMAKVRLMHHMLMQKVGGEWKVTTADSKVKTYNLNDKETITEDKVFVEISNKLQDILFKHPVVLNFGLNILENIFFEMIFEGERPEMEKAAETLAILAARISQDEKLYEELVYKYGDLIDIPEEIYTKK